MTITMSVVGIKEVRGELEGLTPKLARAALDRMSAETYKLGKDGAAKHVSPGPEGGSLLLSLYNREISYDKVYGGASFLYGREVGHDPQIAPYAPFVQWGTKPHTITPKPGSGRKALRWTSGGKYVFAKWVKHPGYVGDAYLVKAADDVLAQFNAIINAEFPAAAGPST